MERKSRHGACPRGVAAALILAGAVLATWGAPQARAGDFDAWTDSARVLLNTTPTGADVSSDVADFPVLVRLTAADLAFSELKADGSDLRFADSAGAALPFELERFDPANKLAEAWVKLPLVRGNSAAQWFSMHWGNPSATSASSGSGVFPDAQGYGGVWHLGEDGGAAAGAYKDATGNGNHGTGQALTASSDVAGVAGVGTNFTAGLAQGIAIPHKASLHGDAGLTVEAWVKSVSQGAYRRFVGKPFTSVAAPWNEYSLEADSSGKKAVFSITLGGAEAGVSGTTAMANGTWYHVVGTWDGAAQKVYVNGVLENSLARTGTVNDYAQALSIGKYGLDGFSNFDGAVDEARVHRVPRGADWIKLGYATQKPGAKWITFQRAAACQGRFAVPPDTSVEEGALIRLDAQVECASAYAWEQVSGPTVRILDPQVRRLEIAMPRVAKDTVLVFRFAADPGGQAKTGEVKVAVREAIPDPVFTLSDIPTWTGSQPLEIKATVTNAAAVAASRAPVIRFAWTVTGVPVDTVLKADAVVLSNPTEAGDVSVTLCLDNGGTPSCKQAVVAVSGTTALRRPGARPGRAMLFGSEEGKRDIRGRLRPRAEAAAPR